MCPSAGFIAWRTKFMLGVIRPHLVSRLVKEHFVPHDSNDERYFISMLNFPMLADFSVYASRQMKVALIRSLSIDSVLLFISYTIHALTIFILISTIIKCFFFFFQ